jgi:hypothetical protein
MWLAVVIGKGISEAAAPGPMRLLHRFGAFAMLLSFGVAVLAIGPHFRVFVEPFGSKSGAAELRSDLVRRLEKEPRVALVSDPGAADFFVSGEGETYIKGYVGTNPRVRYLNGDARPIYGGYLSVEVKDRAHDTVWSYLVTPRRLGAEDINSDLTGQVIRKLMEAMTLPRGSLKQKTSSQ